MWLLPVGEHFHINSFPLDQCSISDSINEKWKMKAGLTLVFCHKELIWDLRVGLKEQSLCLHRARDSFTFPQTLCKLSVFEFYTYIHTKYKYIAHLFLCITVGEHLLFTTSTHLLHGCWLNTGVPDDGVNQRSSRILQISQNRMAHMPRVIREKGSWHVWSWHVLPANVCSCKYPLLEEVGSISLTRQPRFRIGALTTGALKLTTWRAKEVCGLLKNCRLWRKAS